MFIGNDLEKMRSQMFENKEEITRRNDTYYWFILTILLYTFSFT